MLDVDFSPIVPCGCGGGCGKEPLGIGRVAQTEVGIGLRRR